MVTWEDVAKWTAIPLEAAADELAAARRVLAAQADTAAVLTTGASSGITIDALSQTLKRLSGDLSAALARVRAAESATADAADGVRRVRALVGQCEAFTSTRPYLSISADGTVTCALVPTCIVSGMSFGVPFTMDEAADTNRARTHERDALQEQVASMLALARSIDADYASRLEGLDTANHATTNQTRSSIRSLFNRGASPSNKSHGPTVNGLGTPIPGTTAPIPDIDPWVYPGDSPNEGSGAYAQRAPTPFDHVTWLAARSAATAVDPLYPHATEMLNHFLDNTGEPATLDANAMLLDMAPLNSDINNVVRDTALDAVQHAKASGYSGPMTYPFSTGWTNADAGHFGSEDWFYTTGGFSHNTAGTITVYPPDSDGSPWSYECRYEVNVADRYNWDGGKSTNIELPFIEPVHVTDEQLQALHQSGIAREFDMSGRSSLQSISGEVT